MEECRSAHLITLFVKGLNQSFLTFLLASNATPPVICHRECSVSSVKDQWLPDLFSEPVVPIIQSSYSFELIAQHQSLNFSYCHTYKPTNEKKKREREQGLTEDLWWRGPRDIVYSDNMGAIAPIRIANGALFQGDSGVCSSGKIFEIEVLWDAI